MSKKDEFIEYIENLMNNPNVAVAEMTKGAKMYWEALKSKEEKEKSQFTDNGKMILAYMKTADRDIPLKAKDIAEAIGISSRSVSGSMRKLVSDGYIEAIGDNPKSYTITDDGMNIVID